MFLSENWGHSPCGNWKICYFRSIQNPKKTEILLFALVILIAEWIFILKCLYFVLFVCLFFTGFFSSFLFLIKLRRQFRARKIFSGTKFFVSKFLRDLRYSYLCLTLLFRKCVPYLLGCSFIKNCSLTGF